jgi:hypothetical protein
MTTDKVEIFVNIEPRRLTTILEIGGWFNGKWSVLERTHISQDRDNWIDITLPEEIDGEKRFSVQIWHDGLTWKAVMKNRYDKFRDMMVKGIIPTIYELPVTVY